MVRVSGVPYDVELFTVEELELYDKGFEAGVNYERVALLELVELPGMTLKDISRIIRERGIE
jgi:predicted HTH domain antitoxin